jgi:hypothetical protein
VSIRRVNTRGCLRSGGVPEQCRFQTSPPTAFTRPRTQMFRFPYPTILTPANPHSAWAVLLRGLPRDTITNRSPLVRADCLYEYSTLPASSANFVSLEFEGVDQANIVAVQGYQYDSAFCTPRSRTRTSPHRIADFQFSRLRWQRCAIERQKSCR